MLRATMVTVSRTESDKAVIIVDQWPSRCSRRG